MAIRLPAFVGFVLILGIFCLGSPPDRVAEFLDDHCIDCHQGADAEAGFDLESLGEFSDPQAMTNWVRLFDRVADGEMPPEDDGEVPAKMRNSFLNVAHAWIADAQRDEYAKLGRVRGRRLTNLQLQRTLHDLFAIDIPLASLMPEEQRTDGFSNVADGQSMSHFQLESHLSVVDAALDEAFERAADSDDTWTREFSARNLCSRESSTTMSRSGDD